VSSPAHALAQPRRADTTLAYVARVLRVIVGTEFKLKYADSALGYVWSLLKPIALFSVLYVVFGRFFKQEEGFQHYPMYLLIGIVLWTFFNDATSTTLPSVVSHGSLLRKLAFPRLIVPVSVVLTATLTFAINVLAIAGFVVWNRLVPGVDWLLLLPLLAELFVFTLGVSVALATLYVRFRDVGQLWELAAQLLFWSSAIIYPFGFLPPWAQPIAMANPFVQVMQDAREIIAGSGQQTAADVYGTPWGYLIPIGVALLTVTAAVALFRREERWFAERV
jgi:ABC-2 type transport system permease protein